MAAGDGKFDATITFSVMEGGLPYVDVEGLPTLGQFRMYVQGYEPDTRMFLRAKNGRARDPVPVAGQPGVYRAVATGLTFAPENTDAFVARHVIGAGVGAGDAAIVVLIENVFAPVAGDLAAEDGLHGDAMDFIGDGDAGGLALALSTKAG